MSLKFVKWIGIAATTAAVSVIIASFPVARYTGSLDERVQNQQKTLEEIKTQLNDIAKHK